MDIGLFQGAETSPDGAGANRLEVTFPLQGVQALVVTHVHIEGGTVRLDGQDIRIRAQVHTLAGYPAHADQADLLNFVTRMRRPPRQVRLVHGDEGAKATLARLLRPRVPGLAVVVP